MSARSGNSGRTGKPGSGRTAQPEGGGKTSAPGSGRTPRPGGGPGPRTVVIAILLFAILFGWSRLDVSLYYDEAYTVMCFAGRPVDQITTDYSAPNNHIAHSLMLHAWSLVLGDPMMIRTDTWVLRVPHALLFALGVLAFFLAARRLVSPDPVLAAAATAFFADQSHVLTYGTALRGYGMSVALLAIALAVATHPDRLGRVLYTFGLSVPLFLVNYAVPSNVWFTGAFSVAVLVNARAGAEPAERPPLWPTLAAVNLSVVATVLAYLPVLSQMRKAAGDPLSLGDLAKALPERFYTHWSNLLEACGYGLPRLVTLALILAGLAVSRRLGNRTGTPEVEAAAAVPRRAFRLVLPVALVWGVLAAVLTPPGFTRNYVPGHVFFALAQIWAVLGLLDLFGRRRLAPAILCAVALSSGVHHVLTHQSDRRADEVVAFVKANAAPESICAIGEDAELAAHNYYGRAMMLPFPIAYFPAFQSSLFASTPEIWFLYSTAAERDQMMRHHNIPEAAWNRFGHEIKTIGRIHIGVLTRRKLPPDLAR